MNYSPFDKTCHTVELRRKEYAARIAIDDLITRRSTIESEFDNARRQLVMTIRMSIFGKDHPERHVIRYPETWWEALKERWAPVWFRDRYPVKFVQISVSLEELYPEFEPAIPVMNPTVRLFIRKRDDFPVW